MSSSLNPHYRQTSLYDMLSELILTLDLDLQIHWANQMAGDSVNQDPEDLVGSYCYQVWHAGQSPCEGCPVQETIQTGKPGENQVKSPDGRCWYIRSRPLRSQQGDLEGVVGLTLEITERRQIEEKLNRQYELFARIERNSSVGSWEWDIANDQVWWSEELFRIFDRDPAEGAPAFSEQHCLYVFEDYKKLRQAVYDCTTYGTPYELELRAIRKDNQIRHCIARGQAQINSEGQVDRLVGSLQDITERKQKEKALLQSENYYRAIFETSGTAMFIIEYDTTISLVNSNFVDMSGYSREEIEGKKSWTEFMHPDDLDFMMEYHYLRRQNPDLVPRQYEFRFITRYGERRDMFIAVDMIPGSNQSIASGIDITERKQVEQALRVSQKKYIQENKYLENLLEYSADGIGILNQKGRIIRWNKQAAELTGYSFEEIQGRHFSEFYAQQEDMEQLLATLRKNGSVKGWEVSLVHKDGTPIPCSVSVSVLLDENENLIGSISIIRDLTAWKITQAKLEELSIHDSLTGLYNRNFFEEEMQRLSQGRYNPLGIIVCDLDGLKFVNDNLGHQSGDRIIVNAAELLRQNFRSSDIIARIGGDEFAILLPETSLETIEHMLQRLRQAVWKYNNSHPEIRLSMSMGYAVSEEKVSDMQSLFREADDRMYKEKNLERRKRL